MFTRRFEIVIRKRDATSAQLERHVNDRDAVLVEFLLHLEQTNRRTRGGGDIHAPG